MRSSYGGAVLNQGRSPYLSKIISPMPRFCFPTCGILDYMPDTFLMTVSNAIFFG